MLTVQSRMNQASFGNRRMSPEEVEARRQRAEFLRQQQEFEELAHDKSAPEFTKKAFGAAATLLGGAAVGLTAGCGTKILIEKGKAFKNSEFMKNTKKYTEPLKKFVKKSWKNIKKNFNEFTDKIKENIKESKIYRKPAAFIKWKYHAFKTSKIGAPIVNFASKASEFIGKRIQDVKNGKKWLIKQVKSVKPETYEKAAVGTVGVSSGACATVNSIKEKQEAGA